MNRNEFAEFAKTMKKLYPKDTKILRDEESLSLWYQLLKDIPFIDARGGLYEWSCKNKWSPTISEIRSFADEYQKMSMVKLIINNVERREE